MYIISYDPNNKLYKSLLFILPKFEEFLVSSRTWLSIGIIAFTSPLQSPMSDLEALRFQTEKVTTDIDGCLAHCCLV